MRLFWSRRSPEISRILLIESGPRRLGEETILRLRAVFGPRTPIDALHCLDEPPAGADEAWSVRGLSARERRRLLLEIRARRHPAAALLVGGDPIMAPWRWATLPVLPAKFLIVNENADFFWLDRGNWRNLAKFLRHRSGFGGESALRSLGRAAAFPFVLGFLLAYAAWTHARRGVRLAFGHSRGR